MISDKSFLITIQFYDLKQPYNSHFFIHVFFKKKGTLFFHRFPILKSDVYVIMYTTNHIQTYRKLNCSDSSIRTNFNVRLP